MKIEFDCENGKIIVDGNEAVVKITVGDVNFKMTKEEAKDLAKALGLIAK